LQKAYNMTKARPFIKWVGGKNQLIEQFENYYCLVYENNISILPFLPEAIMNKKYPIVLTEAERSELDSQ